MRQLQTLLRNIRYEIEKEKKLIRRKKLMLKIKFFLCMVLPIVIVLLTVKVIKTYLKIKLKNAVIPGLKQKTAPKPLKKKPVGQKVVPEPVGETCEQVRISTDE